MKKYIFSNFKDFVYMAYDDVSHYPIFFFVARNDSEAVRKAMLSLRVPLKDSSLYQIGAFNPDDDKANFNPLHSLRLVPWSSYRLPENMAEALAPIGATPSEIEEIIRNSVKNSEVENE